MHYSLFAELSIVVALAAGVSLIMRILRQPLIIGHIITGLIVGPSVLNLVHSPQTIEVFSSIGIALLLFIIGLGLNPQVIREVGKIASLAGFLQVFASMAIGFLCGRVLGLTNTESVFWGFGLALSSTIIILKLLTDKKEQSRLYGKVLTGILLVQDIVAAIALLLITAKAGDGISVGSLMQLGLKGAVIAVPLLFIGMVILPRFNKLISGSQEFLFLFALGWGFGFAALFEHAGFSLEIGALLAGVALAGLPYTQEISAKLRPLRDFFIVVFFITLGTRLNFDHWVTLLPFILMGCFIVIVIKPLIVLWLMGVLGYTKRTSFKAALATAQISEFSLIFIILGQKIDLVGSQLVSITTIIALISITVSTYLIVYSDKLFDIFEKRLHIYERSKTHSERVRKRRHDIVLFGYRKGGHEFMKVFDRLNKRYLVIDYDPEIIDQLERQKVDYIYGDVSDIELLDEIGLEHMKLAVSTITDFATSQFLVKLLLDQNPNIMIICHAENVAEADNLYELGASYVMMPHYMGSEKIGAFIKRSGFKKTEFKRFREQHQAYLHSHYEVAEN